jgi:hypothetical protein
MPKQFGNILDSANDVAGDDFDGHFSGFDLRDIQQIVNDLQQMIAVPPDGRKRRFPARGAAIGIHFLEHDAHVSQDGRHRRADLMAHVRNEFRLGRRGRLSFRARDFDGGGLLFQRLCLLRQTR